MSTAMRAMRSGAPLLAITVLLAAALPALAQSSGTTTLGGSGALFLSGGNVYGGTTLLNSGAGTLVLAGSTNASPVSTLFTTATVRLDKTHTIHPDIETDYLPRVLQA